MRDWITFLWRVSGNSVDLISSYVFSVSGIPGSQTTGSQYFSAQSLGLFLFLCSLGVWPLQQIAWLFREWRCSQRLEQVKILTNVYSAMVHCGEWKFLLWFWHALAVASMGPCGDPQSDLRCWCCCQQHLEWQFSTWETGTLCLEIWLIQNHQPKMDEYWFPWERPDGEVSLTQRRADTWSYGKFLHSLYVLRF